MSFRLDPRHPSSGYMIPGFNMTIWPVNLDVINASSLSQAKVDSPIMGGDVTTTPIDRSD